MDAASSSESVPVGQRGLVLALATLAAGLVLAAMALVPFRWK